LHNDDVFDVLAATPPSELSRRPRKQSALDAVEAEAIQHPADNRLTIVSVNSETETALVAQRAAERREDLAASQGWAIDSCHTVTTICCQIFDAERDRLADLNRETGFDVSSPPAQNHANELVGPKVGTFHVVHLNRQRKSLSLQTADAAREALLANKAVIATLSAVTRLRHGKQRPDYSASRMTSLLADALRPTSTIALAIKLCDEDSSDSRVLAPWEASHGTDGEA
jgi:hypothetical protein